MVVHYYFAPVAQWIERWTPAPKVADSNSVGRTIKFVKFKAFIALLRFMQHILAKNKAKIINFIIHKPNFNVVVNNILHNCLQKKI